MKEERRGRKWNEMGKILIDEETEREKEREREREGEREKQ